MGEYLVVPFIKESLSWEQLDESFLLEKEWNCTKPSKVAHHWYDNAFNSTGFRSETTTYALDEQGEPTFQEIENKEHCDFYQNLYRENMPYYEIFLNHYRQQQEHCSKNIKCMANSFYTTTISLC